MGLRFVAVAVLGVTLAGCQAGPQARADPVAALDEAFTLGAGQQVGIRDTPLRLRFTAVPEDSRCPSEVECFWSGQARVTVAVDDGSAAPTDVEFNTNPAPGQNRQTAEVDGYLIDLHKLEPYPRTPYESIRSEDYEATLLVRDAG
jgi:hypothetical protein